MADDPNKGVGLNGQPSTKTLMLTTTPSSSSDKNSTRQHPTNATSSYDVDERMYSYPNLHMNENNNNGNRKTKKTKKKKQTTPSSVYEAGLVGAGAKSAVDVFVDSVQQQAVQLAATDVAGEDDNTIGNDTTAATGTGTAPPKISFGSLFYFSTLHEKLWMVVGIVAAGIAGLAMPVWLLLLSHSLETFNDIGTIIAAGGDITILKSEMQKLIYSFAIVGFVTLLSGTTYVSLWSYTGETQTLRIRKAFVKSALRQEAAWYDTRPGDPQELPVLAATALGRIQVALGRAVADTFANLLSAVGCLMVSLGLDPPLALFMVCVLPIIAICIGIIGCFMRAASGKALTEFASAGAFASEGTHRHII